MAAAFLRLPGRARASDLDDDDAGLRGPRRGCISQTRCVQGSL